MFFSQRKATRNEIQLPSASALFSAGTKTTITGGNRWLFLSGHNEKVITYSMAVCTVNPALE